MDHTMFMPHGVCLMWDPLLVWLHVITDSVVALSYYSIPAALFVVWAVKRENIPPRPLVFLFGLFILSCGTGHVIDVWNIWHANYWLKGWWNVGTATASALTALVLIPKVVEYIRMPEVTDQLRRESGLLRALIDSVSEGILLVGRNGQPRVWNAEATALLGNPPRIDWSGHRDTDQDIVTRPDGRIFERFTTHVAPHGQLYVLRDVTERERVQAKLLHAQKMQSLGILAGGVAHQFNNLLTGIIGNASMAVEGLPFHTPERAMIEDVLQTSEKAAYLTQQMLAFSGGGLFMVEPLDLSLQVRDIAALIAGSIPDRVSVVFALDDNPPKVQADASQIRQALTNLILNAAEAIGDRSGTITIATGVCDQPERQRSPYFSPLDARAGRYVYLEVRDTGAGMEESILPRIFDPFFTTKFTGRGLGLPAVLGIVRAHQGAVRVVSRPGAGTTFTLLFPPAGERQ